MDLRSWSEGRSEVLGALVADRLGHLHETASGLAELGGDLAATTAVVLAELASAGAALGLRQLQLVQTKSERRAFLAALRDETFLLVAADPRRTSSVQTLLESWQRGDSGATPPPAAAPNLGQPIASSPPPPPPSPAAGDDAWTRLRRAFVRGQLTEAAACRHELGDASAAIGGRPGSETLPAAELERALQLLLHGVGGVLAGDGRGGGRFLREVADAGQRNLSFRWLALHWRARAALKSGSLTAAATDAKEALAVAKRLDEEARAVTHGAIGELIPYGKDPSSALPWLADARARFERLGDAWGIGQAGMGQVRVLALLGRESEAVEAARQLCATDARWDEPPVFLAARALQGGDLPAAEQILAPYRTDTAQRARSVLEAVRQRAVSLADAGEYLRERDAPAGARSIRAMDRIARAAPRFAQARIALAWMLVNVGRTSDASLIFRGLLARDLAPAERDSVVLGLERSAHAEEDERGGESGLSGAARVEATTSAPPGVARDDPTPAEPAPSGPTSLPSPSSQASSAPASAAGTAFSGEFSALALPELLEFLRTGRRTGLLLCKSPAGTCALSFADGNITGAASPATPRIGPLLVQACQVTPEAMSAAAGLLGVDVADHVLSGYLLREGLVQSAAVEEALIRQVDVAMRELLQWEDGAFVFEREVEGFEGFAASSGEPAPVAIPVHAVLMRLFQERSGATCDVAAAAEAR